jgi:hypothetical protein
MASKFKQSEPPPEVVADIINKLEDIQQDTEGYLAQIEVNIGRNNTQKITSKIPQWTKSLEQKFTAVIKTATDLKKEVSFLTQAKKKSTTWKLG